MSVIVAPPGLSNVVVTDTRVGDVRGDEGFYQYRQYSAIELARQFANEPLAAIIYTDIATDGMMRGPNVAAMAEMQSAVDVPIIASGGVTSMSDVSRLLETGVAGCIIGRALYEGTLSLTDAIRIASGNGASKTCK